MAFIQRSTLGQAFDGFNDLCCLGNCGAETVAEHNNEGNTTRDKNTHSDEHPKDSMICVA